jgi:hypothetical protein
MYQTTSDFLKDQYVYTSIYRDGTQKVHPQGLSDKGWMTLLLQEYEQLLYRVFLKQYRAETSTIRSVGYKLHHKEQTYFSRMGIGDSPNSRLLRMKSV